MAFFQDAAAIAAVNGAGVAMAPASLTPDDPTRWSCAGQRSKSPDVFDLSAPCALKIVYNATGWVRVCGFANVCNNQTVSGTGLGTTRSAAALAAKNACVGMMRARGGYGSCTVACNGG